MDTQVPKTFPSWSPDTFAAMVEDARRSYPRECCGFLRPAAPGEPLHYQRCENRQDRLHQLDPTTHPRTAREAYNIGGRDLLQLAKSFSSATPAEVIVHSHPDVGAYFSEEDARAARSSGWPVDYLVLDARASGVHEARLFRLRGESFVEIARYDAQGAMVTRDEAAASSAKA